jgi:hypothetical protein
MYSCVVSRLIGTPVDGPTVLLRGARRKRVHALEAEVGSLRAENAALRPLRFLRCHLQLVLQAQGSSWDKTSGCPSMKASCAEFFQKYIFKFPKIFSKFVPVGFSRSSRRNRAEWPA